MSETRTETAGRWDRVVKGYQGELTGLAGLLAYLWRNNKVQDRFACVAAIERKHGLAGALKVHDAVEAMLVKLGWTEPLDEEGLELFSDGENEEWSLEGFIL